jgi:hypothetical protein
MWKLSRGAAIAKIWCDFRVMVSCAVVDYVGDDLRDIGLVDGDGKPKASLI